MIEAVTKGPWAQRLTVLALVLSVGGLIAALVAAVGSGQGAWHFGVGFGILRYAFYAAIAGGIVAVVAFVMSRRSGARTGRLNLLALVVALLFAGYLTSYIMTARSVPAIHDVTTDLVDPPQFAALSVRADNLENIPDGGRPERGAMDPESRWKALHREAYGDLRPLRLPGTVASTKKLGQSLMLDRGWKIAKIAPDAGTIEATATTLFFRFKDDVVLRVRPDPAREGGSIVDMRSISRVGGSDVGVNAERIRAFLRDLQQG